MFQGINKVRLLMATAAVSVLAACQTPPPPPVAPVVVPQYTPRAPTTPFGASINTIVPQLRPDGLRQTINRDIGPLQTVWHVRAALNVAALSCTGPQYERIVSDYNAFIGNNKRFLRNANSAILRKFRRDIGNGYQQAHDRHQTRLYNYWSFSPLRRPFCDQAVQVSQRAIVTKPEDMEAFGAQALMELEKPFTDFYLAYEEYERDLDAWRRQYAPEQAQDAADETINTTGLTEGG
ncbi:hypothetical protein [Parasphingorhabdus cellanae]|uniref:Lipoprotein n=1 Tax=Parasphingorhabdus cellanae TaxID=2806553 RepID=A0ABX7T7F6_9SPHN|nr:hypothetical protein [Parasphingorhabdus cellanae]QTD56795.1 hypothetical protein J4G78_04240 [Parasphingorhabdus cellanae]